MAVTTAGLSNPSFNAKFSGYVLVHKKTRSSLEDQAFITGKKLPTAQWRLHRLLELRFPKNP